MKRWQAVAGAVLLGLGADAALADRPFVATTSAAAEEDDDRVWSTSTWVHRDRRSSETGLAAEYAFEPRLSTEFTLARAKPRSPGSEAALEAEAELKWLYNSIARDGWGIGVSIGIGAGKDGDAGWRAGHRQVAVPFSWQWSDAGGLLHLNAGVARERGARREALASAGLEAPLARRWLAFAELARGGDERLAHAGVRWWIKRERFALDLSALRRRPEGEGAVTAWVINLSACDL
ncbi:MAG: hypothetical protein HZC37_08540 [Burkholderiales bacterium]|nr:hypothetical protein [Burkholderiales bacterium]